MRCQLSLCFSGVPSRQATMARARKIPVVLILLLAGYAGALLAQDSACTKNCRDDTEGPCSGLKGKAHAQCLGQCLQSCKPHQRPPISFKAMDVIYSLDLVDSNGLARNPLWFRQKQTGQPPDPNEFCPASSDDPSVWRNKADCTDEILHFNSSDFCSGHMNWFPVEYEGTITWADHSKGLFDDDDYYAYVDRPGHALETGASGDTRQGIEIEFDAGETVDYWDNTNTWWDDFHHNHVDQSNQSAHDAIDGKEVIVIGMLGLDTWHHVHSELHPIYAMFVHFEGEAMQDRWAFFVRNWGNEGGCGSDQEPLPTGFLNQNQLRVLIRHPAGQNASVTDNVWVYGDDEGERDQQGWAYQPTNEGLLLTFSLRDPSKQVGFVGDLTINWGLSGGNNTTAAAKTTAPTATPSRVQVEQDDENLALKTKVERLTPADRQLLLRGVKDLIHHPRAKKKPGTRSTVPPPALVKPTGMYPDYGNTFKPVRDPAGLARKAKRHEFIRAFLKAHGVE